MKKRERVFIIPNWYGLMYALGITACLITAATYSNNLIYALSFFLVGIFLIGMIQANSNMKGIEVDKVQFIPGEELSSAKAIVWLKNNSKDEKYLLGVKLKEFDKSNLCTTEHIEGLGLVKAEFEFATHAIGKYKVDKINVNSVFPFGLFYAWKILKTDATYYVYPRPEGNLLFPMSEISGDSQHHQYGSGGEDFSEHKVYEKGEAVQHIDWKAFARGRGMLTKQFNDGDKNNIELNIDSKLVGSRKKSLRQLSKWVFYCSEEKLSYSIRLDGSTILPPGSGALQKNKALKVLSSESCDEL